MSEDDTIRDDEETPLSDDVLEDLVDEDDEDLELGVGVDDKKKVIEKDLIDDDTVSLDDEADDELEEEEEPFDDITNY